MAYGGSVSCSELRWVWVSFAAGVVSAGMGQVVGENVCSLYNDPVPSTTDTLAHIGYSSNPSNPPSTWVFPGCYYPPRMWSILITIMH